MLEITMTNWMCHADATIRVDTGVAFIVGANGAGKTAIRDALEFAYLGTGQLRGIGSKKELAQLSIADGADACEVTVVTDEMILRRSMKRDASQKLQRALRRNDDSGAFGAFEAVPLGKDGSPIAEVGADVVRTMLEPTAFMRLDGARRRELLIHATTDQSAGQARIIEVLREMLEPESDDDVAAIEQAARWASEHGFRYALEQAVASRRAAKRQLADAKPPEMPDRIFEGVDLTGATLAQHERRLEDLRGEHERALEARASSAGAIEGKLEAARNAMQVIERRIESFGDLPDVDALRERREADNAALRDLEASAVEHGISIDERRELDQLQQRTVELEALKAGAESFNKPGQCPAVPFEMKCPVKRETFLKRMPSVESAEADLEAARQRIADADERDRQLAQIESEQSELMQRIAQTDSEIEHALEQRSQLEEAEGALAEVRETMRQLERQLEEAADRAPSDESPDAVLLRIRKGERIVAAKRAYDAAEARGRELDAARERLEAEIQRWDAICHGLEPDGAEARLGGGARDAFMALLADARALTGEIQIDADYSLKAGPEQRHPLQLSTSQRMAVGVALQHTFCRLVSFPILCCDAIDTFDAATRRNWLDFARTVAPSYSGAVLGLATLSREAPGTPPPGVTMVWLTDGMVAYREAGATD